MLWNIEILLSFNFSTNKALWFNVRVLTLPNIMDELNVSIVIFLVSFMFFFFLPHVQKRFGEKQHLLLYTARINRVPTLVLQNLSPFEKLFGKPPGYSILEPFGCACFVLVQPHEHTKLDPRAL